VAYIAEYLYHGVNYYGRAIEILFIAHKGKLLDEAGQWELVTFLHEQKRYGESVAPLQAMVEWRPDNIQYRTALMHAYFETTRQAELLGLLEQTDEYFHKPGRWNENAMAALAQSCLENHLYERSVKYYKELIPLHQRTQPNRGIGNGTLSGYYDRMGRAYAGLGKTAEAVDAACGAIISWGPTSPSRADATRSLLDVIRQAPKLDEFVVELDRQSAETGLQNPIVRKAVGQVYLEKKEYDKAIAQLKLASEVQPGDVETHRALVACYDQRKDREGAISQILQSVQLSRREITLYADLGRRFAALERPKDAERAYTSIIEVLPAESESHAALAEIRQEQGRWAEAAPQWTEVARIRALEPTGLLKLGAAQVHLKQWEALGDTIRKLRARSWPARFGDVESQIRNLERSQDEAPQPEGRRSR
jgi:tetratricopeptide (TPR) repeat protein